MTLRKINKIVLLGLVLLQLILLGSFFWVRLDLTIGEQNYQAGESITFSTDSPDETKIDKRTYNWVGLEDEPKYIELPTIGAEGFIQKVGIDQNKQIAVPSNIHLAGWFSESSKPGRPGLSIIDGHLTGRMNDAVFKNLANLKVGDQFFITLGNNQKINYEVLGVDSIDLAKSADTLFSQDINVGSQLNLITCGGNYLDNQRTYDQRIIVSAKYLGQ